jgi:hypothetical protein
MDLSSDMGSRRVTHHAKGFSFVFINTIKDELPLIFVSFRIIVYPAILRVNLPGRIEILGNVHLQVRYKPSVT